MTKIISLQNVIEIHIDAFWCAYMHNYSMQLTFMNQAKKRPLAFLIY